MSTPASTLISKTARLSPGDRVLLLGPDVSLARWAVGQGASVTAFHTSHTILRQLAAVVPVSESVYPDPAVHGPADVVLLTISKGRDFTRASLWTGAAALRPGGKFYLAGPNDAGAKSAIADAAALLGSAPILGYKGGGRIALSMRPDHLDIPAEWGRPWEAQTRTISRPEGDTTITTMPGVFSWDHLDDGTALLLDHLGVTPGERVLDIGCGYGIIGLAAARAGAIVTMVDDDLLAIRCAAASVQANGLADRCTVLPSDVTESVRDQTFDLVLSNPPFHQGTDVTTVTAERFVRESFAVLRPGGRLRIVANRFLPYQGPIQNIFGGVTVVAQTSRFMVLEAIHP